MALEHCKPIHDSYLLLLHGQTNFLINKHLTIKYINKFT